jgi:hypothetical protein
MLPVLYSLYLACLYTTLAHPASLAPSKDEKTVNSAQSNSTVRICFFFFVDIVNKHNISYSLLFQPNTLRQALSLCFSLPTSIRRLQLASLLINSLLFLAAVDLVAEPYLNDAPNVSFTRVGAVYPDAVKISIRYPSTIEPIHVLWRQSRDNINQTWTVGPSVTLSQVNDWVNITLLPQLWPNTDYECM